MQSWPAVVLWLLASGLAGPAMAQNLIVQDGWQGFAVRSADGQFERCVLYNRTIEALNSSPYDMLGVTRDRTGNIGLTVFYRPRSLTRGRGLPVSLKLDQDPAVRMSGDALSDFHIVIAGPIASDTLAALRRTNSLEVTVEDKTLRVAVAGLGAVFDRLSSCVTTYAH